MLKRIALSQIVPNSDQPRKNFDAKDLAELAGSIKENGLQQPVTVRPLGNNLYEIVAGERRWRAHGLLAKQGAICKALGNLEGGAPTIMAHVRKMDEEQRDIEAIVENLNRADITPMEQARAFQRMLDRGMSIEVLAKKCGINQTWRIAEKCRLLKLSPDLQKLYESGNLGGEAAYEISRLEKHADQTRIVQMIGRGQLSGYKAVKAAVQAIIDKLSQVDIFGAGAPVVSEAEVATVNRMEAKIEQVGAMLAAGWKDGECIIARKVSPDRARVMADKIKTMRTALLKMENDLREAAAQADLLAA
ncbi:MAG: ParB/RepB/Spo0J family partition protein [Bradyrhizobium sp.]|nr:ParB/RepB/Spo0J family partition protein [Bradyrhizobium sp.]